MSGCSPKMLKEVGFDENFSQFLLLVYPSQSVLIDHNRLLENSRQEKLSTGQTKQALSMYFLESLIFLLTIFW